MQHFDMSECERSLHLANQKKRIVYIPRHERQKRHVSGNLISIRKERKPHLREADCIASGRVLDGGSRDVILAPRALEAVKVLVGRV